MSLVPLLLRQRPCYAASSFRVFDTCSFFTGAKRTDLRNTPNTPTLGSMLSELTANIHLTTLHVKSDYALGEFCAKPDLQMFRVAESQDSLGDKYSGKF